MMESITAFFTRIFDAIGRFLAAIGRAIVRPFAVAGGWYTRRGWMLRAILILIVALWALSYVVFIWQTQRYVNFDPGYVSRYDFAARTVDPGEQEAGTQACANSALVQVAADLIDFNVNQNQWVPSLLLYRLGFFGMPWRYTPFFDNKAAFQLGINQVLRRTSIELVDRLGRVRGTSQIDQNLQDARTDLSYSEEAWYWGLSPFGPQLPTWSKYRTARTNLLRFNERLARCDATFDARADNLLEFLDRVSSDIGSTSDILRDRIEYSNAGWFDPRADDRFWFAYGQLYAYYGILSAANADFANVFSDRGLARLWERTVEQLRTALDMQPFIISNGSESSWIMPSHLASMGFYLLRVRSNLVEIRDVLTR